MGRFHKHHHHHQYLCGRGGCRDASPLGRTCASSSTSSSSSKLCLILLLLLLSDTFTMTTTAAVANSETSDDGAMSDRIVDSHLEILSDRQRSFDECLVAAPTFKKSSLVKITSWSQNEEVRQFLQGRGVSRAWLGARESLSTPGTYVWVADGESISVNSTSTPPPGGRPYNNWAQYRPNPSISNGAVMLDYVQGRWIDVHSSTKLWCMVLVPDRNMTITQELVPFDFPPAVEPEAKRKPWATAVIIVCSMFVLFFTAGAVALLVWHHMRPVREKSFSVADAELGQAGAPEVIPATKKGKGKNKKHVEPTKREGDTDEEGDDVPVPEALRFLDEEETKTIADSLGQPLDAVFPELAEAESKLQAEIEEEKAAKEAAAAEARAKAEKAAEDKKAGSSADSKKDSGTPPPPSINVQQPSNNPSPTASPEPAAGGATTAATAGGNLTVPPMALGQNGNIPGRPPTTTAALPSPKPALPPAARALPGPKKAVAAAPSTAIKSRQLPAAKPAAAKPASKPAATTKPSATTKPTAAKPKAASPPRAASPSSPKKSSSTTTPAKKSSGGSSSSATKKSSSGKSGSSSSSSKKPSSSSKSSKKK